MSTSHTFDFPVELLRLRIPIQIIIKGVSGPWAIVTC